MSTRPGLERPSLAVLCAVALLGAGCRKETPPPAETKTEVKPAPAPTEAPRKPRVVDEGVEVPTEEDFEEAVEKQITSASNLQKELDQLEKEIQKP